MREYNNYESRDIWEYELNLTDAQVVLLAAHLFELGSAIIPYYYIGGNCSYYILAALQAVAPELHLLDHVGIPVVPADTIKALYANPGLVRDPSGPAPASSSPPAWNLCRRRSARSSKRWPGTPMLISRPAIPTASASASSTPPPIWSISAMPRSCRSSPTAWAAGFKQRILERRAQLLLPSEKLDVPQPATMPQESHGSARLSAGFVDSDINGPAVSLGYRMALHALDDPLGGYPDLAQIEFFPTEVRVDGQTGVVHLERLDFIDVLSLHEMTSFDQRLSWKLRAGSERIYDGVQGLPRGAGEPSAAARARSWGR